LAQAPILSFGDNRYDDFTIHKSLNRKNNYISRHEKRERWNKTRLLTPGFWSKHILWNKESLRSSINDTIVKFNIKIILLEKD
jgi:hypothetical protein